MIKNKIQNEKGISLIVLTITIAVIVILANIVIYNVKDNLKIGNLKEMQNDISNLRDKISSYYATNGTIPAKLPYTNISHLRSAGVISQAVDGNEFLVIDLSAMDNLTLNRGQDYEQIKTLTSLTEEEAKKYTDLYIINKTSHNIFYVAGITLDNETFYTDIEEVDTAFVDLRYKEGVKIPEGYHYVEGTKELGILIKNEDGSKSFKWMLVEEEITEVPEDVEINQKEKEDFIKSVNNYHGYYKNTNSNEVMYFGLDKWSPKYDEEAIYKDKNGDVTYIPKDFSVSETPGQNTIDEGLVVKDNVDNEWVWIEVPKSIYKTAESSEDYEKIEKDMQDYVADYRQDGYVDTWSSESQHGFSNSEDYNNLKNIMLKSVYEKGGFFIGRYEAGTIEPRSSKDNELTIAIIKRDAYPYNFVTCKQAQEKSVELSSLATEGKTTSLMFGIQWDLMLKFIDSKGAKTQEELKINSGTWGNYVDVTFNLVRGKYTTNPSTLAWNEANNTTKLTSEVLLTTGATNRNSILNIYDVAGNLWEWTLEYSNNTENPSVFRAGGYGNNGTEMTASKRYFYTAPDTYVDFGFRPTLY